MRVDLDGMTFQNASILLGYCLDKGIDITTVEEIQSIWASPLAMVDDDTEWVIDIPDEHVTWLHLKGIL